LRIDTPITKLYNTLLTIETKGAHTKTMADCLRFTEQLISLQPDKQQEEANEVSTED
jgi:hypothetical protein